MGAEAEAKALVVASHALKIGSRRAGWQEEFWPAKDTPQRRIDDGIIVAEVTAKLIPVLEEAAEENPDIGRAKQWGIHIFPYFRPMLSVPHLDKYSGVLTQASYYFNETIMSDARGALIPNALDETMLCLRWGNKLAPSDAERVQIQTFSALPENPFLAFWESFRKSQKGQTLQVVDHDYYQALTIVDPESVIVEVCRPGRDNLDLADYVVETYRLLDTQQVIKNPRDILPLLHDALQFPRYEKLVKQISASAVAA